MPRPTDFIWTARALRILTEAWAEGLTTPQIAERLGPPCTKNAVIGKAHRLKLQPRQSPIKGEMKGRKPRPKKPAPERKRTPKPEAKKVVLTLVPTPTPMPAAARVPAPVSAPRPAPALVVVAAPVATPEPVPTRFLPRAPRDCCWPIGEPRTPEFRFCDAVALLGKPYCQEHYDIAYRPFKPKAEHLADQTAIGAEIANKKGALRLRATMGR